MMANDASKGDQHVSSEEKVTSSDAASPDLEAAIPTAVLGNEQTSQHSLQDQEPQLHQPLLPQQCTSPEAICHTQIEDDSAAAPTNGEQQEEVQQQRQQVDETQECHAPPQPNQQQEEGEYHLLRQPSHQQQGLEEPKPRQLLRPSNDLPEVFYYEVEDDSETTTSTCSSMHKHSGAAPQTPVISGPCDDLFKMSQEILRDQDTLASSVSVGGLPSSHALHHRQHQASPFFRQASSMGGMDRVPGQHRRFWLDWFGNCVIIRPKWLRGPVFHQRVRMMALAAVIALAVVTPKASYTHQSKIRVAMIGNSMMYYNDFPRLIQALSDHVIDQDACLHGDATLQSILITGSGMYKVWRTGVAQIENATVQLYGEGEEEEDQGEDSRDENDGRRQPDDFTRLYDYGACTVPQLLFGYDPALDELMDGWKFDDAYKSYGDDHFDDDDYYVIDKRDVYNYEFKKFMDGTNPCLMDPNYYEYRNYLFYGAGARSEDDDAANDDDYNNFVSNNPYYDSAQQQQMQYRYPAHVKSPRWDFILMNDNTRSPASFYYRQMGLNILEHKYLLWFQETRARPVFIFTHAYATPYRDMGARATNEDDLFDDDYQRDSSGATYPNNGNRPLSDIPYFASLTYEGYRQYAALLSERLPPEQQPLIAPVGLAFLTIWEENFRFWDSKMFHIDRIHASPSGTYLQGLVVHHTLLGRLPHKATAIDSLESLFNEARRMQPVKHRSLPLPTREDAAYLYEIAHRVCVLGHVPKSFIRFEHGEASYYVPNDVPYYNDDIYRK